MSDSTRTTSITGNAMECGAHLADTHIIPALAKTIDAMRAMAGPVRAPDEVLKLWTGIMSAMCGAMCADVGTPSTETVMQQLAGFCRDNAPNKPH